MPRVYDSQSNPVDYCKRCFPATEAVAFKLHGHSGDGPDGRGNCFGYDAEHPEYDDTDYVCERCGRKLTGRDDMPHNYVELPRRRY